MRHINAASAAQRGAAAGVRLNRRRDAREPVRARTRCQIVNSGRYGTNALPSVLVSDDGAEFRLFAGGFMDAAQLEGGIERWLAQ